MSKNLKFYALLRAVLLFYVGSDAPRLTSVRAISYDKGYYGKRQLRTQPVRLFLLFDKSYMQSENPQ